MTGLQDALDRWDSERSEHVINRINSDTEDVSLFVDAARQVANAPEIRYCLWHERRAADNSGDEDSGVIPTRFCSSQDGSHDCVVETRLLLDVLGITVPAE